MKRVLALLLVLMIVFAACTPAPAQPPAQPDPPDQGDAPDTADDAPTGDRPVVAVAMLDMTHEFFVNMIYAGDQAAARAEVDIIWQSADSNLERQIALIENFIEMEVDAILVDPFDAEALIPVAERAMAAGIPFLSMGNFIDSPAVTSNLYNDRQDTYTIAQLLLRTIDEEGEVGMLYGAAGNFVSDERQIGWETAVAGFPNVSNQSLPVGWDVAETLRVAADLLVSTPNIAAIHSFSDGNTAGLLTAVEQAGRTPGVDIIITSYDGDPEIAQLVADGQVLVTLLTGARRVGYWMVWTGAQLAHGYDVPLRNYLQSHFVMTEETRAQFEEWGLGYPGISIVTPEEAIRIGNVDFAADFADFR